MEAPDVDNFDAGAVRVPETRAPESPPSDPAEFTPDQLSESKQYGRRELACTLIDMLIDVTYLGVMAFWGGRFVDRWLSQSSLLEQFPLLRLVCLVLVITALHYVLSFPLSLYGGFLLEHRFGLSRQSFWRWLRRYALQSVLVLAFGLVMMTGLYLIIWWAHAWWWLAAALAAFVVTILLGQLVPVLIMPLFYEIERLEDDDLLQRFERLTRGTTLNIEGVYRMKLSAETAKANALLAGLGRTRRVILGDTLLSNFTPREIEVVLAHEIGHHVHHHITKLILLGLVYTGVSFFVCDRVLVSWVTAVEGTFEYANCPVYTLPLIMFVVTVFSLVLSPLRNGLSRQFETTCDRYALQVTGDAEAYRSAFTNLARLNKSDPNPSRWEVFWFHDHPPVAARLALVRQAESDSVGVTAVGRGYRRDAE
ncbi:MAG: M48 family metalloprotease [Pirellulaceae bacterium]